MYKTESIFLNHTLYIHTKDQQYMCMSQQLQHDASTNMDLKFLF